MTAALQVARDAETRCKCLAYLGWAVIRQRDSSKLNQAWASFDQFEREADDEDIPPMLLSLVKEGRAVQCLHAGDRSQARIFSEQAFRLDESAGSAHELLQLLRRPGVTTSEALEFILAQVTGKALNPTSKAMIS